MTESKELIKLYTELEKNFGFDKVDKLRSEFSRILQKVSDLEKSRNAWKFEALELRKYVQKEKIKEIIKEKNERTNKD